MRRLVAFMLSGLLAGMEGRPLGAQQPAAIEVGLASAYFPDDDAVAGGPYVRLSRAVSAPNWFGSFDGGALTAPGSASGFGTLRLALRTGAGRGLSSSVEGEATSVAGSSHSGAAGTGIGGVRVTWSSSNGGTWLRGIAHSSVRANSTLAGAGVDAGAWWSWPQVQLSASLTHERTRAELYTGKFRSGFLGTTPVAYTDATFTLHGEGDRATFEATGGIRRDGDAATLWAPMATASAAFWTNDRMAIVLSAAHQLPDWVRGADAAEAFSVGLRFRQSAPEIVRAQRVLPIVQLSGDDESHVLRIRAAGARVVDVMGDFTEWEARALTRNGDVFVSAMTLSPGSHRLLVRIDGGPWRTAINTPVIDDDLGGKVGLLVVP